MKRSLSEIRTRANELRELLETGATKITVDGTSTEIDLKQVRAELRSLERQLPEHRDRRPRASRIHLGGF